MQYIVNIIIASAEYTLIALGFSLVYQVVRFFHFAFGIIITSCAYFAFLFITWFGLPLVFATILALLCSILFGCLIEVVVYSQIRRSHGSPLTLLLSSLGIYIVFQNIISMVFGDGAKTIHFGLVGEGINVLGARVTFIQVTAICTTIILSIIVTLLLRKTKIGKAMRAVANDQELAIVSGINSDYVILWSFALSSGLAGIAGVLMALNVDMTPSMGLNALLMGVVVVIIGGDGSVPGLWLGALLLAITQQLVAWKIGAEWQDLIAYFILILFLFLKPQGFFGKRIKTNTV